MPIIYEPKGKAREYAELAANLYSGCSHQCKYCYCPLIQSTTMDKWSANPHPRKEVLKLFARDAGRADDEIKNKELLFSFMSDPFQSKFAAHTTKTAMLICEKVGWQNVTILTKNGQMALDYCGDLLRRNGWQFGQTVSFLSEEMRQEWEPGAPSIRSRIKAFYMALAMGISTWVSIEPVIDPDEALAVMKTLREVVDGFKVGKLNHRPSIEAKIDWSSFLAKAKEVLFGKKVYWKKDLLLAAGEL